MRCVARIFVSDSQLLETLNMWPQGHRMSDEEEGVRGKDRPPRLVPSFDVITGV